MVWLFEFALFNRRPPFWHLLAFSVRPRSLLLGCNVSDPFLGDLLADLLLQQDELFSQILNDHLTVRDLEREHLLALWQRLDVYWFQVVDGDR